MKLVPLKQSKRRTPNVERSTPNHQSHVSHQSHQTQQMDAPSHEGHEMHMEMHSSIDIADPMSREGSGTSWLPDSSPMYGRMFMFDENMLMLHGAIFPRYTNVSTRRGDDRIDAPNWIMAMFSHPLGNTAQFGTRLMMSLDHSPKAAPGIRCPFKAAHRGTTRLCTIGHVRHTSSMNSQ